MNNILKIRKRLGLSQVAFGKAIDVSQGNVSHYEQGRQEVPPEVARRVIASAEAMGHAVTFDDIYQPAPGAEKAACGLVMLKSEAERRAEAFEAELREERLKNRVLMDALRAGRTN